jgi:hypothetical protein
MRSPAVAVELKLRCAFHQQVFVKAFTMRCFASIVLLLSIYAGATEPREDLKPLGAFNLSFRCFASHKVSLHACSLNCRIQPNIVSNTGAP